MAYVIRTDDIVIVDAAGTGLGVPAGTTAQRPTTPTVGMIRYNTDGPFLELWDGATWNVVGSGGGGGGSFVQKSGDIMSGDLAFQDFAQVRAANASGYGAPSYAFRDDATTGLGRLGTGELFLTYGGTVYMSVDGTADVLVLGTAGGGTVLYTDGTGRLGVGTTSPQSELHVAGTGAVRIPAGTMAERPVSPVQGMLRLETGAGVLEYYDGTTWQTIVSSASAGTVSSVDVQPGSAGLATSGGPITTSGTITVSLADDLLAIEQLSSIGFAVRTGADTWVTRSLQSNTANITITNPDGAAGAPQFDLTVTGVAPGTWTQVTVDAYGRVTAGAQASISDLLPPTTDVSWANFRLTDLADPVDPQDAATRNYVDGTLASFSTDIKDSVRAATAGVGDLFGMTYDPAAEGGPTAAVWTVSGSPTFDGVALADGDRVLIKDAADARGNGIFTYDAGSNAFRRAPDADNSPGAEVSGGMRALVIEGTQNGGSEWFLASPLGTVTLGTDNLVFSRFAAGVAQVDTGIGLTGGPITSTGTIDLDGQALEFHQLASDGLVVRAGAPPGNILTRTITGAAGQIDVTDGDGVAGDPLIAIAADPVLPGTGAVTIPAGSALDRPSSPVEGMIRVNTSNSPPNLEFWDGVSWARVLDDNGTGTFVLRSGDTMSGTLGVIEGTVGAPGLHFASDPATGVFAPGGAGGAFGVSVSGNRVLESVASTGRTILAAPGGTDALTIDATGSIGVFTVPSGTAVFEIVGRTWVRSADLAVDGYVEQSVETGIVATGSGLTDAYGLTKPVNEVSAVPAGTGVRLDPNTPIGARVLIVNAGANDLNVYPPTTSGSLNQQAPGSPLVLAAGSVGQAVRIDSLNWWLF